MMNEIKISVIIPAYNVELYIEECVKSVISQTYKNLEIIVVDDGSTDGTGNIVTDLSRVYPEIVVYHKENGGLSDARNYGISRANGDYIVFLDSDDFWDDKDALKKLSERVWKTGADVLNYSYKKYYPDGKSECYFKDIPPMPEGKILLSEQQNYLSENELYIASACNKMIKMSLFSSDLLFKKGVYSEDIEWSARLLLKAQSQDFICENFYCYRQRETSITHTVTNEKCMNLCDNIMKVIKLCESNMDNELLLKYAAYQYGTFIMTQSHAKEFPGEAINKLSKYLWILQYHGKNKKLFILNIVGKIVGLKGLCQISRIIFGNGKG